MVRVPSTSRSHVPKRASWGWLVLAAVAKCYLVLLGALGLIALVPVALGWHSSVVQTGSMEPLISPGDVVLATDLPADAAVPVGGVVQYHSPAAAEPSGVAKVRLHRIVAANDDGTFTTAGDANTSVDSSPITRRQIIGQGRLLAPLVGLPSLWIDNGNIAALAMWTALTALAVAVAASRPEPPVHSPTTPQRHERGEHGSALGRRPVLVTTSIAVIAVVATAPHQDSAAAFTATTKSAHSTWTTAAPAPLTPGRVTPYALFASSGIINEGPPGQTTITGSLGTTPGGAITGFVGNVHADRDNAVARSAKADAVALYTAAASRPQTCSASALLTGSVTPGTYRASGALSVDGTLTLDAQGDSSAVFVFIGDSFTAGANSSITLTDGASAANVYWISAGDLTVGTNSISKGTYVTQGNATIRSGATIEGRIIALGGMITLDHAHVTLPR